MTLKHSVDWDSFSGLDTDGLQWSDVTLYRSQKSCTDETLEGV